MKKTVLITFLGMLFIIESLNAQINKGTVLLGGNIGFSFTESNQSVNETEFKNFYFSPSLGFTIQQNRVLGFNLNYSRTTEVVSGVPESDRKNQGFGGGVFLRQYLPVAKNFYLFGEAGADFNYSQLNTYPGTDVTSKQMNYSAFISLHPGISYAIRKNIHLELGLNDLVTLGYNRYEIEITSPASHSHTKTHSYSMNANLSTSTPFYVGFRFVLNRDKSNSN